MWLILSAATLAACSVVAAAAHALHAMLDVTTSFRSALTQSTQLTSAASGSFMPPQPVNPDPDTV